MKTYRMFAILMLCVLINGCSSLKPVASIQNGRLHDYKYIYITQTKSLTSSSGVSINGQYYSTSKSVNPRDIISGILAKEGFILLPEIKNEFSSETLIVNYGESGRRGTGLGGYAIEVTIQFVLLESSTLICSCTAEGQGTTEADDIREAITRCLNSIISKTN